ncbi:uncharacterized protein (DUF2235 family) [Lysobacter sp. OAE881]|uniref:DUF2235 domain-containing protein n=1 Tax=Lysobacter sp. OAE881 TaxID=2663813 RepID=UPI00178A052D
MANIAIFLDGTWNDPKDRTSVFELKECLDVASNVPDRQQCYYSAGVGVKRFEKFRGGAFGMGLSENVLQAYRWLVKTYRDGDRIFLFGFSRGAYTARSLAGLIARCGLLHAQYGDRADAIYERYRLDKKAERIDELEYIRRHDKRPLTADEDRLLRESRRVEIEMIGVWDTVGSLGIPWSAAPIFGPKDYYFLNTRPSVLYRHCFHALAIDEHRGPYQPTLWTRFVPAGERADAKPALPLDRFEQRWFIGAHSNIGGGYGGQDALRNPPLIWMQEKAQALGLRFTRTFEPSGNEATTQPAKSYEQFMHGLYRVATLGRRTWRTIGGDATPVKGGVSIPINETIDGSVFDWCRANHQVPKNLADWAQRKSRNAGTLAGLQNA